MFKIGKRLQDWSPTFVKTSVLQVQIQIQVFVSGTLPIPIPVIPMPTMVGLSLII